MVVPALPAVRVTAARCGGTAVLRPSTVAMAVGVRTRLILPRLGALGTGRPVGGRHLRRLVGTGGSLGLVLHLHLQVPRLHRLLLRLRLRVKRLHLPALLRLLLATHLRLQALRLLLLVLLPHHPALPPYPQVLPQLHQVPHQHPQATHPPLQHPQPHPQPHPPPLPPAPAPAAASAATSSTTATAPPALAGLPPTNGWTSNPPGPPPSPT